MASGGRVGSTSADGLHLPCDWYYLTLALAIPCLHQLHTFHLALKVATGMRPSSTLALCDKQALHAGLTKYAPKKGFSLWGLLWPEQCIRTEHLRNFASFQLAPAGADRCHILQQAEASTCYVNLICSHTRLIVSTARGSRTRVVQPGVWLGSCVTAHGLPGP